MPSLVEISRVVLEEDFLNFVNVFSLFHNYLPLEKSWALHLNKIESPLPYIGFVPSLVGFGLVVLEKKIFKFC